MRQVPAVIDIIIFIVIIDIPAESNACYSSDYRLYRYQFQRVQDMNGRIMLTVIRPEPVTDKLPDNRPGKAMAAAFQFYQPF